MGFEGRGRDSFDVLESGLVVPKALLVNTWYFWGSRCPQRAPSEKANSFDSKRQVEITKGKVRVTGPEKRKESGRKEKRRQRTSRRSSRKSEALLIQV